MNRRFRVLLSSSVDRLCSEHLGGEGVLKGSAERAEELRGEISRETVAVVVLFVL